MKELMELLKDPKENHAEWFKKIADELMRNYVIKTGASEYRLLEIEFYYHSEQHKDEATYGYAKNFDDLEKKQLRIYRHKIAQRNQLTWFIHYSGIDIVLGSKNNPGGILIRAIQNTDEKKEVIKGPLVVLLELMNQRMSVDESGTFKLSLVKEDGLFETGEEIEQQKRIGINTGGYENAYYNFFVSPPVKPAPTSKWASCAESGC